jgi:hypothetical protein
VERLIEYQRAVRMSAQQHFTLDLAERMKLVQIFCQTQNILFVVGNPIAQIKTPSEWFSHLFQILVALDITSN